LVEIIEQLIRPDPDARVQSADALLDALLALPADTSARRQLAALVTERRGAISAPPADALADTAVSVPPPALTKTRPSERPVASKAAATVVRTPRSSFVLLAAAIALLATVIAMAFLRRGSSEAHEGTPSAASTPPLAKPTAPDPTPEPLPPTPSKPSEGRESRDAGHKPHRPARAHLRVSVVPFGEVYVDGKHRGTAPIEVKLAAGTHRVEARTQGTSIQRTVKLRAGERRNLVLR
jgi:hypothetical protein